MKARVLSIEEASASNYYGIKRELCVAGKVHLSHSSQFYDQSGREEEAFESEFWGNLRPCDGTCEIELPQRVADIVQGFIDSGGRERGQINERTKK